MFWKWILKNETIKDMKREWEINGIMYKIYALTSSRWFWGKFIFCNNFITSRASARHKSISRRWKCFTQWHFHSKLAYNMSPSSPTKRVALSRNNEGKMLELRMSVELISWCFDKAKCHWKIKILLPASFMLAPSDHPSLLLPTPCSWIMCRLFCSLLKILYFLCFHHVSRSRRE